MSSRIRKQMQRARNNGLTNSQFAALKQSASFHAERVASEMRKEIESEAVEKGFVLGLTLCMNVLLSDYWQKSGEKRFPEFCEKCYSLFQSVMEGCVDYDDCVAFVEEMSKTTVETEWRKAKGNSEKVKNMGKDGAENGSSKTK